VKRSTDRILTTHVGSLPRPAALREMEQAGRTNSEAYNGALRDGVRDVVRKQVEVGLDIINDGEIYKPSWSGYIRERLKGFEERMRPPENIGYNNRGREAQEFAGYFSERSTGAGGIGGGGLGAPGPRGGAAVAAAPPETMMVVGGEITYVGQDAVRRDVETLKGAVDALRVPSGRTEVADVFMAAVGPDNIDYQPGVNQYYASEADYVRGCAKALKNEYKAITDAGFILQIDTPVMKFNALQLTLPDFRKRFATLVEVLNDTLADIPQEQVRLHICFGGGRGPHAGDIMLKDFMDLVLQVRATAISFDQNVRHEHEWAIWKDMKLPEGKVLIPGVVAHTTDTIEHPELVAQRLVRYANLVGRENVIAGTDCGLGGRLHPDIVWAKFRSQAEGARLATKELW
jgi:5-methyltetrahydropteroyltriglutamate--homocysteine methyltransferase